MRDLLAHARREDLGAAAGQRIEAGLDQPLEHLAIRHLVDVGEERDLDGGEALQVNPGPDLLQPAQHVGVVLERQIGMQPVDDVDLGERLVRALPQLVEHLLERQRVSGRRLRRQPRERAEQAARDADVGRLEPDVEVVVGELAVPPLALAVGEVPDGEQIRAFEQPHAVLERQPLPRVDLRGDVGDAGGGDPSFDHPALF